MSTRGKLEALITVPTGGWDISIDDSGGGGPATATIPAGTYYLSSAGSGANDLIAEVQSQLDTAATTDTITVTISAGEGGAGKVTIASTGTYSLTWTDTELRNILGFDANITSQTSATGANQAMGLWLPDCVFRALNAGGSWPGVIEAAYNATEAPDGSVVVTMGPRKRINSLEWPAVTRAKTHEVNESTTNESFESFLTDCLYGEVTGFAAGGPIRWYSDADTDGTYITYRPVQLSAFAPSQFLEDMTGHWRVVLPRLVEVP